jgi:2-dehydro-3-deoxyphosphooctonate aldolase (KDO 8-P synthase)
MLLACGRTGKPVNIKKGQFVSPWDMAHAVRKVESTGNRRILITERGTTFGYGNLVVDMRSLAILRSFGHPVIFDATHSVQLPGGLGHATGGDRRHIWPLTRAAAAVGVAGVFFETHPDPDHALSDGPNALALRDVPRFARMARRIDSVVKKELL